MAFNAVTFGLEESDVIGFTPAQRTAIELQLCISIADEATWKYYNFKFPRWENFYGYAQIMSGEFVVEDIPIRHINQEVLHWRDISYGINQTTGCYAVGLAQLIGNGPLVANTVKTRQRFTSVRVKFSPGIKANCCLTWETAEPKCNDVSTEPQNDQARPPDPKNHQHDPSQRPAQQGGDNDDPTVNDGDHYDNPAQRPPYAKLFPSSGNWYEVYTGLNGNPGGGCALYSGQYKIPNATDPNITPTIERTGNGNCPGSYNGKVFYNGQEVDQPGGYVTMDFEFRST